MNEIEERNSLDPEEVAQSAIESDISYVGAVQLNTLMMCLSFTLMNISSV